MGIKGRQSTNGLLVGVGLGVIALLMTLRGAGLANSIDQFLRLNRFR